MTVLISSIMVNRRSGGTVGDTKVQLFSDDEQVSLRGESVEKGRRKGGKEKKH